jgi:hypothetical protein
LIAHEPRIHRPRPGRGNAGEQERRRRRLRLKKFLDDKAAHRMAHKDRGAGEAGNHRRNVLDIVADAAAMKLGSPFTGAMRSKTERVRLKAMGGEVTEKELVPAPGAVPSPVDEQDRRRMAQA